jgi:hypothetical protein
MHPRFSAFWLFFSALRTQCGEEGLPAQMRKMSKDPPSDIEHWITQVFTFIFCSHLPESNVVQ